MTTAAEQYFDMLVKDEDFAQKIIETGEDKLAKQKIIKDYGLEFTKEEFDQCTKEYAAMLFKDDGELTDKGLEAVSGGGFGGLFGGALLGAIVGGFTGGIVTAAGGGIIGGVAQSNVKLGNIALGAGSGLVAGTIGGAVAGAVAGGGIGFFLPF